MKKNTKQPDPSSLVRLKQKGQVVIPEEIRQKLELIKGDYFEVTTDGKRVVFTPKKVTIADRE
jgi:AbrB family looped-hinge helix DNA binding protein